MAKNKSSFNYIPVVKYSFRWLYIVIPVAIAIGSMVALFLWLLSWAIHFRFSHKWLLYLLPLAGIVIHFAYRLYGSSAEKGNNLIIDEIHRPGAGVPKRMSPLIIVTTVITHLFGGSAGREGTAVQIGGSVANLFGSWFKLRPGEMKTILTAGIAAGFGAVFGTPLTGAVFAMEVLTIGRVKFRAFWPCLIAGFIGDVTVSAWGIKHTAYHIDQALISTVLSFDNVVFILLLIIKIIAASACFGLASVAFAEIAHGIKSFFLKLFKHTWMIPVCGGIIIIVLTYIAGKPDYLSLGVDAEHPGAVTIVSAFQTGGANMFSWLWKLVYTTLTLGTGFKGGEVTPLFYIGATLGNTLAALFNAPVSLFAALGFIAVFAGATNTPIACSLMGIELFGSEYALFFAIACFTAYLASGNTGIYASQLLHFSGNENDHNLNYLRKKLFKYKLRK